jgi:AGZA family xanthine/uracil permease-like MFS transporter
MLNRIFKLTDNNTTAKTEILAGITTFMTMAYIIFVQPQVLGAAGMDRGAVMVVTCLAAAIGTFIMGFSANYPIGVAPGMGENFFFAYTLVLAMGVPWEKALAIVFMSGILFILLTLVKIRELVIEAVPDCLKYGIAAGIGLFIALIGMHEAGIVVANPGGLVKLGSLHEPPALLAIFGVLFTSILLVRRIKGAILLGIIASAIAGTAFGILKYDGLVAMPPSIAPTFLKMDIRGILHLQYIVPVIIFLYMALFDTIGTLIGVTSQAGIMKNGRMPRASQALMADAAATTIGAALGTSTTLAYIESIAGVKAGGKTGLTAIVIGILFLAAIFFFPLVEMISGGVTLTSGQAVHPVTAPALILVGSMMVWGIKNIEWENLFDAIPAFLTIIAIPFTYSIADGIAIGFISYPVLKLFGGKAREVSWLVYLLGALFILRYIFL